MVATLNIITVIFVTVNVVEKPIHLVTVMKRVVVVVGGGGVWTDREWR